jgi:ophiobolin F synthase
MITPKVMTTGEICQLHIGQSYDLHWTFHCKAPSIDEYMKQLEKS